VSDAALEAWVKTRLYEAIGRRAFGIKVEVTGGAVSLRGPVPSEGYKTIALETAETTAGIWKVIDLITVEP
jgi:osmotically-inducible protein OsmY